MTHFQELLKPELANDVSAPGKDQERASRDLPGVVKVSNLGWWCEPSAMPAEGTVLVVWIAPYSQYDLAMLDILDETLPPSSSSLDLPSVPVYVANLEEYQSVEQLTKDIPLLKRFPLQTPVAAVWEDGMFRETASGKLGRDLVATTLGISSEDFNQRVIARVPRSTISG